MTDSFGDQRSRIKGAVDVAVSTMIRKKDSYMQGISQNVSLCNMAAARLVRGGEFEKLFDDEGFMTQQRKRLKTLAEENIQRTRQVEAFTQALGTIKKELHNDNNNSEVEEEEEDVLANIEEKLQEYIEQEKEKIDGEEVLYHQEKIYLDLLQKMGEPLPSARRGNADDDVVVEESNNTTRNLICPLTQKLIEVPVRNKVCGHVYSKEAITIQLRQQKDRRCPVVGCRVKDMTMSQLEDDMETAQLVRREKNKAQREQQALSQKAIDADDDDENEAFI